MSETKPNKPPSLGVRKQQTEQRKKQVLDAMLTLVKERGYAAIGISDIRERSGVSVGSIYHHFGSKDGVGAALYESLLDQYREGLREQANLKRSARKALQGIVFYHIDWSIKHVDEARYLMRMRRNSTIMSINGPLRSATKALFLEIFEHLKPHIDAGKIAVLPPQLYHPLLLGPAQEMLRQWFSGRFQLDPKAFRTELADAAWRSLAVPKSAKKKKKRK